MSGVAKELCCNRGRKRCILQITWWFVTSMPQTCFLWHCEGIFSCRLKQYHFYYVCYDTDTALSATFCTAISDWMNLNEIIGFFWKQLKMVRFTVALMSKQMNLVSDQTIYCIGLHRPRLEGTWNSVSIHLIHLLVETFCFYSTAQPP